MDCVQFKIIARIYNDYKEKFGIPRQSGIAKNMKSKIVFEKPYSDELAFRDIEQYSHLWILWVFSENVDAKFNPTVRPPRLGGNKRVGVFATRSPFRPNPIGLSCVKLHEVINDENGISLVVSGADLMNGTPIIDIKPYVKYSDSKSQAICGFSDDFADYRLKVDYDDNLLSCFDESQKAALIETLSSDPRPAYQNEPERIYKMRFADFTVSFSVNGDRLKIVMIDKTSD